MRAFTVLLALVATPFLAGVSQSSQGLKCDNGRGDEHRSVQGTANAHKGACKPQDPPSPPPVLDADQDGVPDNLDSCPNTPLGTAVDASGCPLPSTPPPPPPPTSGGGCVNSGSAGGTASIDGQVFVDASPWPGLQGWCVQANGPMSVTAVTDASGNYLFPGLPAGTYTVCEVLPPNTTWRETFPTSGPACASGPGWTIPVIDGGGVGFVWFGNLNP